jgi:beta-glucanase (GH16 family)
VDGALNIHQHTENIGGVQRPLGAVIGPKSAGQWHRQLYGKYTVCFEAPSLKGYKIAWMLWPVSEQWPRDGEIDFPEGSLDGHIAAYVHRQNGTSGGDQDAYPTSIPVASGWHVASIEWHPSRTVFLLDNAVIGVSTNRIPNTPMRWTIQCETDFYNKQPAPTTEGRIRIDWAVMYARV